MSQALPADLDRRFGIPGVARVVEGKGRLAKVVVTTSEAAGELYLHGAQVTSWRPRGAEEVLFVSSASRWEHQHPIRGGIPICFPWFADKADDSKAPAHGFVRTALWQLESIEQAENALAVTLSTMSNDETRRWWPADFQLRYRVLFGTVLKLELAVRNCGATAVRFEEALHTYFRVGQIERVRIQGLDAIQYIDKTDAFRVKRQQGPLAIASQTDRVFLNTKTPAVVEDESLGRRIHVAKNNSLTTVVWNPWIEKARALADFGDDEWKQMVCVETCNVADFAMDLAPGMEHMMQAGITIGTVPSQGK